MNLQSTVCSFLLLIAITFLNSKDGYSLPNLSDFPNLHLEYILDSEDLIIAGHISDDAGEPLSGVNIYIERTRHGVASAPDGSFQLVAEVTDTDVLVISMVGFESRRFVISDIREQADSLQVFLTQISAVSDDIFVTASRISQLTGTVPVSFRSIDAMEISARNLSKLDESLRYVPGLTVSENQVSVRGSTGFSYGTGSRVLLLVDGSPLMGPDQNDIRFTAIPMSQVQRVEIIKGPGSALYGSGALGGVINLITKPIDSDPEIAFRTFVGIHEPTTNKIWKRNWEEAGDVRLFGGAEFSYSDVVNSRLGLRFNGIYLGDQGYLENSRGYSVQGYLKLDYNVSDAVNIDIQMILRHHRHQIFLYWNGKNDPLRYGRIAFGNFTGNGKSYTTGQQATVLPTLRHVVNDRFYYHIRGRVYAIQSQPLFSDGTKQPKEKQIKGLRYGAESEFTWLPNIASSSLIFGATADAIATDAEIYIGNDNERLRHQPEYALFTQIESMPVDRIRVSGGLRYDAYQIDTQDVASKLSPKLNVSAQITPDVLLRTSYGKGFRVPAISERFVNSSDYLPLEPNMDLRPEESTGYEIGVRYTTSIQRSMRLTFDLVGFQNDYKNLIEPKFRRQIIAFQFLNLTQANIKGIESTFDASDISGKYNFTIGYTFLDHEDVNTKEPLSYRSDHQFIAGGSFSLFKHFQVGLDYQYLSEPQKVDTDFSIFIQDASESNDKHVIDLRFSSKLNHIFFKNNDQGDATLTLKVMNLLNYYYIERPAYMARPRMFEMSVQVRL